MLDQVFSLSVHDAGLQGLIHFREAITCGIDRARGTAPPEPSRLNAEFQAL